MLDQEYQLLPPFDSQQDWTIQDTDTAQDLVKGFDPFLWYLAGSWTEPPTGTAAVMQDHGPFDGRASTILQQGMLQPAQDDRHRSKDSDDGQMYDLHLSEFMNGMSEGEGLIGPRELAETSPGNELYTVHCQLYRTTDGEWSLEHWDPGVYKSSERSRIKQKFIADNGPSLEQEQSTQDHDGLFIDNNSYSLDDGLELVADTLDTIADQYRERALAVEEDDSILSIPQLDESYLEYASEFLDEMNDVRDAAGHDRYDTDALLADWEPSLEEAYTDATADFPDLDYDLDSSYYDFEVQDDMRTAGDWLDDSSVAFTDDDPYELAWSSARWKAMAEAVRTLADQYQFE